MRLIFLTCILFSVIYTNAQSDVLQKPDILPPSPEAAAFAKNINIPVSYSSGTPQISVPFYSVKSGSIEIPVSISYNASGIRVEETSTWVGLGWSLSAGGQISRSIRGNADETPNWGYLNVPSYRTVRYVDSAHCKCSTDPLSYQIEEDIAQHGLDLEPDLYSFSILGYSGDFMYNQDSGKYILFPKQNILVEGNPGSFVLTLPNGVKAYFGGSGYEETLLSGSTASYVDGVSYTPTDIGNVPQGNSWVVSEIIDPTGKSVVFSYIDEWVLSFGRGGERFGKSMSDNMEVMRRQSFFRQYLRKPVIQKISGENVNVYFKRSSVSRLDMPNYSGGSRSLDTLTITTKNGIEIKSFYFKYDYFVSPAHTGGGLLMIDTYAEEARRRLFLKSITEKRGVDSLPPYEFTYSNIGLPSRFSTAQDYWGYYNGKPEGNYVMPKLYGVGFYPYAPNYNEDNHILPSYGGFMNTDGADRRIDTNYSQARILKSIKYPTGGTTDYFYEQNSASAEQLNIYGGMVPPDAVDKSFTFSLLSNPMPSEPPYDLYYSGTFTVNIPTTKLKITPQMQTCGAFNDASCKLTTRIKSLPDNTVLLTMTTTNVQILNLNRGSYLVEVLVNGSTDDYPPSFNILCQWSERTDSINFPVGGVRVKRIVSRDGVGKTISRSFTYNYDSTAKSSGLIEGCPTYKMHDFNSANELIRRYYVSNSVIPLSTDGKTVRYEHVTEYYDSTQSSFKTTYTFSSGLSNPVKFAMSRNGAPMYSWNWQNNLLKRKKVFEKNGSSFRLISEEESFHYFHKPVFELYGFFGPQLLRYELVTEWYLPDSSTTINYSYEGGQTKVLKSGVKQLYNDFLLQSYSRTTNSKGEIIHSKTWYPIDYNNVSGFNIQSLINKHIWAIPIKQETSINGKILSGSIIKYNLNGLPEEGYAYENALLADTSAHNRNVILDNNYKLKTTLSYDDLNNIKQIDNYKSGPGTYIWDYQNNLFEGGYMNEMPMAMVQNAESNQVAYTSFENASKGGWYYTGSPSQVNAVTGSKVYSLGLGSVTKGGLIPSGIYIVSYWSAAQKAVSNSSSVKTGPTYNGWTYYEHKVMNPSSGTITVSGTGNIDELRLYPQDAQMNSYAYNEMWMVNAMCDVNNRITYYEYDVFGRLSLVRDQSGNILKKICYNYAGQPDDCGLGNDAQWQVDSMYCEVSNGLLTGNLIKLERDSNPNSTSFNQTRSVSVPNLAECPTCTTSTCYGNDKKCINNVCETAVKIYTSSSYMKGVWRCYYYYKWSDNSTSPQYMENSSGPCTL